jgi:uncharacterized OsmC-like protein
MNTSELIYEGGLRTYATHVFSGTRIYTDAPLDNQGKAQSFSPTDLVATALAACMITIMGIEARKAGLDLNQTTMEVKKFMGTGPRRIVKIGIVFNIPNTGISMEHRHMLEHAAHNCPVAKSIHPEIEQDVQFNYV